MQVADPPRPAARLLPMSGRAGLAAHTGQHGDLVVRGTDELLAELGRAGLRGRGGGGFPTAAKLAAYRRHGASVLAVNATESEPASRKDAVLLDVSPHLVLDGAQLAARVAGAMDVALCLHADSPARSSVEAAIAERRRAGVREAPIEVVEVPDRYVAGEESALSNFVMTGRSVPLFRPAKDVPMRFRRGGTVLVHNAETLAHLALIAHHGADRWCESGAGGEPGTRLVTISGAVRLPGVHEVPAGAPLAWVVGRGEPAEAIGAVLVGGCGGTFVAAEHLGAPFSPAGLAPLGAHPGAGVLVVSPAGRCALGEVARIARYLAGESAGQCGPCVFGLPAIASDLELLAAARLGISGLDRLRSRLGVVGGRGACRHPDGAVRMARSALDVFAADVAAHLHGGCLLREPAHPARHDA